MVVIPTVVQAEQKGDKHTNKLRTVPVLNELEVDKDDLTNSEA
jgi:hypothetical protein